MGWAENLQNAAFRGVTFDVQSTQENITRDRAVYEYPHVDGADVKDLGRKPRQFRLSAFIWGDRYEYTLQRLITALDTPGPGELIHPIYGSVPAVIVTGYDVRHDADNRDSCTVELNFLENNTGTALFSQQLPGQFGDDLFDKLDALNDELATFFDAVMTPINQGVGLIKRGETAASTMINTLLTFKSDVTYTTQELSWYTDSPAAFVRELQNVLEIHTANSAGAIPALALSAPTTRIGLPDKTPVPVASASSVLSTWGNIVSEMNAVVQLPTQFVNGDVTPTFPLPQQSSLEDIQDLTAVYAVVTAAELVSAAASIVSDDAQGDQLSPADIEMLVNDARTQVQSAINLLRERYEPALQLASSTTEPVGLMWQPVVSQLQTVGLGIQDLGLLVITRRPPLTRKHVQSDSCLRLLAHLWYGDHARAIELQRLNPAVRNPNSITAGMVLNAYSR